MNGEEERDRIFRDCFRFFTEKARRVVNVLRMETTETALVAIHVDDPPWTDFANALMPGDDWQKYRDAGEIPIARGVVKWEAVKIVCSMVPSICGVLEEKPTSGYLYALVLAGGGASVYEVPFT